MHTERPVSSDGFRPDVEGLRGLAVALVVLFHAGIAGVAGGFIGVDVFFIISGFLITGLLIRERERSGTISMRAFYARRVRRLLPAATVALLFTLVVSMAVIAPLDRPNVALDGVAAGLSVANMRFALAAGDYFNPVTTPSPFLHFWSLGVEEQFYLVWPALLLLVSRISKRPRRDIGVALAVLLAVSFVANLVITDAAVSIAFYSLPTRAWQLALGGLLACVGPAILRVGARPLAIAGWLGLAGVVFAALTYDSSLSYPGLAAALPSLAALALLAGGQVRHGPGALMAVGPMRFLGKISYSLYLWHWPLLILPLVAFGGVVGSSDVSGGAELPFEARLGLIGLSIIAATLSWRFIEEPFRRSLPAFFKPAGRTILSGGISIALVVVIGGSVSMAANAELAASDSSFVSSAGPQETDDPADWITPTAAPSAAPTPVPSLGSDPTATPTIAPTPTPTPTIEPVIALPSDVKPSLAGARGDEDRLRHDGCLAFERVTAPPTCVYGDEDSDYVVALVGDSHAAQWEPALERIADKRGWKLVTFAKVSCGFLDMRVANLALKREYRECADWNDAVVKKLGALKPDLTIVAMSRLAIHPVRDADAGTAAQGAAIARMIEKVPGKVAIIADTPDAKSDVPSCLSRHTDDVRACTIPLERALRADQGAIERVAAEATGAGLLDLTASMCDANGCPVVIGNYIVFRDEAHLTRSFARSLAPELDRQIAALP